MPSSATPRGTAQGWGWSVALSLAPVPAAGLKEKGTTPLVQGAGTDGVRLCPRRVLSAPGGCAAGLYPDGVSIAARAACRDLTAAPLWRTERAPPLEVTSEAAAGQEGRQLATYSRGLLGPQVIYLV